MCKYESLTPGYDIILGGCTNNETKGNYHFSIIKGHRKIGHSFLLSFIKLSALVKEVLCLVTACGWYGVRN